MYICQKCKKVQSSRTPSFKEVVETREKTYPKGGVGTEIVKEIMVCPSCYGISERG